MFLSILFTAKHPQAVQPGKGRVFFRIRQVAAIGAACPIIRRSARADNPKIRIRISWVSSERAGAIIKRNRLCRSKENAGWYTRIIRRRARTALPTSNRIRNSWMKPPQRAGAVVNRHHLLRRNPEKARLSQKLALEKFPIFCRLNTFRVPER